jgi:sugar lactone lactonase YvrE
MTVPADGGRFYFDIADAPGCAYQAVTDSGFVSLAAGAAGVGGGRVYFDVAANPLMSSRTAAIAVSGGTFALTQAASSWQASLGTAAPTIAAAGGTVTVNVTIAGEAPGWTALSGASWVQPKEWNGSPASGWVTLAVAPNLGPTPRTATLTIAGTNFTIAQSGGAASGNGGVSTIAGLSPVGASGGLAAGVSFHTFARMDLDALGNLYLAETAGHRIRKITPEGQVATIAGSGLPESSGDDGPAVLAQTHAPRAICVDPLGNVFFSDESGLRKISVAGEVSMVDRKGAYANSIARGPDGSLYLTIFQDVERLTPQGEWVHVAGTGTPGFGGDGGPSASAQLTNPGELAVDPLGRLYINDGGNSRIRMVDTNGVIATVVGTGNPGFSGDGGQALHAELNYPAGLTLDPSGALVVSDDKHIRRIANGVIQSIAGLQECGASADSGLASASRVGIPEAVRFLPDSSYLYLSGFDKKIRKVDVAGQISVYAGDNASIGDGEAANSAAFDFEFSDGKIARDTVGHLYVADRDHHRIRKVSADGFVSTFAGTGANDSGADRLPAAQTAVMYPSAVTFSTAGELYIGEEARVRKVRAGGDTVSLAGTGEPGFSGDGGLATLAKIQQVTGLTLDPSGNLYIATQDCRVRRVTPDGVISAFAGTNQCGSDGDGGPAVKARMGMARDIVADAEGNVFIAVSSSIRKVDINGVITTLATRDGASDFCPFGLFLASDGELYFSSGTRISKLTRDGQRVDIIGWGTDPGEAVRPPQARLYDASGMLLDPDGNLFFAEGGADGPHRLRKVSFGLALDRPELSFPAAGGADSVQATAPSSTYQWSVSSDTTWLHVAEGGVTGSGPVSLTVDVNPSSQARVGLLTVGDRFLVVRQDAAGSAPPAL